MQVLVLETEEYYAERFNPPYALVTPFGVDGYRASMVNRFNHKQEFMNSDIGILQAKKKRFSLALMNKHCLIILMIVSQHMSKA
jgi:hypothetical protein